MPYFTPSLFSQKCPWEKYLTQKWPWINDSSALLLRIKRILVDFHFTVRVIQRWNRYCKKYLATISFRIRLESLFSNILKFYNCLQVLLMLLMNWKNVLATRNWSGHTYPHYLMGLGPNPKKIPQNSGKQIRIPEGM